MPLIVQVLETQIRSAFQKQAGKVNEGDKSEDAINEMAADIAAAIDQYIKSGTVNTVVTGTSPAGPVTGTGVGSIS